MRLLSPTVAVGILLVVVAPASAQLTVRHVPAAAAPSALFRDGQGRVHVLAAGVDRNFNGSFEPDSGDVAAAWLVFDPSAYNVLDSMSFGCFFSSFPVRAGVDPTGTLYVAQLGRVRAFSLNDQSLLRDTVVVGDYSGVSWDPIQETLLLHRRPYNAPGTVVRFDPARERVVAEVLAGANPQMSLTRINTASGLPEAYTLAEGSFGSPTSQLTWSSYVDDLFGARNGTPLMSGVSDMFSDGERMFIADTRAQQVHVVGLASFRESPESPIVMAIASGDGPRCLTLQDDSTVLVGTHQGVLVGYDLGNRAETGRVTLPGTVESIVARSGLVYAAIRASGIRPDSQIVVVNLQTWAPVDTISVGPEPSELLLDKRGKIHAFGQSREGGPGWWAIVNGTTSEVLSSQLLAGTLASSFRVGYDPETDRLYVPIGSAVHAYSASEPGSTSIAYRDSVLGATRGGAFVAVSAEPDHFVVTWRPPDTAFIPGAVFVIRRQDGAVAAMSTTGVYPKETVSIPPLRGPAQPKLSLVTLNDGRVGPASTLSYFAFTADILAPDALGTAANHMLTSVDDSTLVVTLNGSHQLAFVNAETWEVTHRIDTRTTGYDGPRWTAEMEVPAIPPNPGYFLYATASYDGALRLTRRTSDTAGDWTIIDIGGKGESVLFGRGIFQVFVARAFRPDYSADSVLAVVEYPLSVRANRAGGAVLGVVHPNPAGDRARVRVEPPSTGRMRLELRSMDGALARVVFEDVVPESSAVIDVPVGGLASGSYVLVLTTGGRVHATPLRVVR